MSNKPGNNIINIENSIKLFTDKIVTVPNYTLELTLMAQSYMSTIQRRTMSGKMSLKIS